MILSSFEYLVVIKTNRKILYANVKWYFNDSFLILNGISLYLNINKVHTINELITYVSLDICVVKNNYSIFEYINF